MSPEYTVYQLSGLFPINGHHVPEFFHNRNSKAQVATDNVFARFVTELIVHVWVVNILASNCCPSIHSNRYLSSTSLVIYVSISSVFKLIRLLYIIYILR